MKTTFRKLKSKIINYRKYKNFSNDFQRHSFRRAIAGLELIMMIINKFLRIYRNTLDRFAPRKNVHQSQ